MTSTIKRYSPVLFTTVPATSRRMKKPIISIMTIQTNKTVLLTTYSHIMKLLVISTRKSLMKMENTGHSGRFLEFNIHLPATRTGVVVNIMYKCYGKLEKSPLSHLISLQRIFLSNLHSMQLRTVY